MHLAKNRWSKLPSKTEILRRFYPLNLHVSNFQLFNVIPLKFIIFCLIQFTNFRRFFFGKISPKSKRHCKWGYSKSKEGSEKSMHARWYCSAHFDLFFPEPANAPHIVSGAYQTGKNFLFDISRKYINVAGELRDSWSKICFKYYSINYIKLKSNVHLKTCSRFYRSITPAHVLRVGPQWQRIDVDEKLLERSHSKHLER